MHHSIATKVKACALTVLLICSLFAGIPTTTVSATQTETNEGAPVDDSSGTPEEGQEPVEKTLTGITATKQVAEYTIGTQIDWTDLTVKAQYSNGTETEIPKKTDATDGYTITGQENVDSSKVGEYEVTITYQEKTAKITIKINEAVTLASISATKSRVLYSSYETPKWNDITVTAYYSNEETKTIELKSDTNPNGYTIATDTYNSQQVGEQKITISYTEGDKTVTYDLVMSVQNVLSDLKAKKTKKSYSVNDTLNLDDLTVTAYYNNNTSSRVLSADEYTTNADTLKMAPSGTKKLEISYTEKKVLSTASQVTKTVTVNIKVKAPEIPIVNGVRTANVLDFGADPTDIYTDKAAIQDALDVSTSDGVPLVVYIPAGTYYIGNTLYIHSNTTIHMEPGATIIRNSHIEEDDSRNGVNHNMLRAANSGTDTDVVGGYDNVKNIVIEGGVWDGGDISQATITANIINIGHAENVTIRNTTIKNSYGAHLIEFAGVKNSEIYGCYFTGFRKETNGVDCEAIQLDVCYSDWNGAYKADKTVCNNVNIHDNQFENYPVAAGNHHVLTGYHNKNITITNNVLNNLEGGYQGIYLFGFDNTTVSNNTISGYENGVKTNQAVNYTITKNTISNCDFGIVSAGSSTGKITSNKISNTNYQGIFAYDATKITSISKNTLTKVGIKTSAPRDGIAACGYGVEINEIKSNTIDTTLRYGIYIYSGALATSITSNTIKNTKKSGIYIYNAKTKTTIKSNKLTKVGSTAIKIASSTYVKQKYTFAPKVKKLNLKKGTLTFTAANLKKVQLNFKKKSYSKNTTKKSDSLTFTAYKKSVKTANVLFTDKNKNVVTKVVTVK